MKSITAITLTAFGLAILGSVAVLGYQDVEGSWPSTKIHSRSMWPSTAARLSTNLSGVPMSSSTASSSLPGRFPRDRHRTIQPCP